MHVFGDDFELVHEEKGLVAFLGQRSRMIIVVAKAFVGDRVTAADHFRAFAAFGSHERFAVFQRGDDNGLQAVAPGITAGHETRARRSRHWLHIELREFRAPRGQLVYIRRFYVSAAIESDIFPAEIVGDDVDDVGFLLRCRCGHGYSYGGQGGSPTKNSFMV